MKKVSLLSLVIAVVSTFISCKKDGAQGPQGAQGASGPSLSGSLVGYMDLYDSYGYMQKSDSVAISVVGKSNTAISDSTGRFTIANLTTGTYEVDFNRTNYQPTKLPSVNFVGGGTQYFGAKIQMTKAPTFSLSAASISTTTISVTYTISASATDTKPRKIIVFCGTHSSVSSSPLNYLTTTINNIAMGNISCTGTIPLNTIYDLGFVSGQTAYFIAYPISVASNASTYLDVSTGKTIYNNINVSGATPTFSILVP